MRSYITSVFGGLVLSALLVFGATAQVPEVEDTINQQIEAFKADDFAEAFTFATPTLQRLFQSPQNFERMVINGYPMVWRPARYELLKLVETEAGLVQVVLFEDASGMLHDAGYLMQQIDGVWRINGVHVRVRPGVGT